MPVALLALAVLLCVTVLAQEASTSQKASRKAVTVAGRVSDDGRMFVCDRDAQVWTLANPEAVRGHEGQQITVQGYLRAEEGEFHILHVNAEKNERTFTPHYADSAFRR